MWFVMGRQTAQGKKVNLIKVVIIPEFKLFIDIVFLFGGRIFRFQTRIKSIFCLYAASFLNNTMTYKRWRKGLRLPVAHLRSVVRYCRYMKSWIISMRNGCN